MQENLNTGSSQDATLGASVPAPAALPGMLPIGTRVQQKVVVIKGTIAGYHVSADQQTISYLITYLDADGTYQEKYFTHDQLEVL